MTTHDGRRGPSDDEELEELQETVERLGVDVGPVMRRGSDHNFVGVRSQHVLVSRRLDSHTWFIHDDRFGAGRPAGFSLSSDEDHLSRSRAILEALGVDGREVGDFSLAKETGQSARWDHESGRAVLDDTEDGKRLARLTRQVGEVPVWDSHLVLGLTEAGAIGYLEVHWPELSSHTVQEARRLKFKVGDNWTRPEHAGASVESVEAGILHSPAAAFVLDVAPAIRVIFRPDDPRYGKKPVLHLDRHGRPVAMPRQAHIAPEEALRRHVPDDAERRAS